MKKVALKFLLILIGIICIDLSVGFIGNQLILKGAAKSVVGQTSLLNYSLNGVDADIIILGSSEASSAYIPSLIKERLKDNTGNDYSVFNAGTYYQGIAFCYCVERGLIDRGNPKLFVLDLVYDYLIPRDYSSVTPQLRPYSHVNPFVKDLLSHNDGKSEQLMSISNMYRLNSEIVKIVPAIFDNTYTDGFDAHKGALPEGEIKGARPSTVDEISEVAKYELESFFKLAKDNNIPVICTISPKYYIMPEDCESFKQMLEICNKYGIVILDLYKMREFDNSSFFHDNGHVNPEGATICTNYLVDAIEEYIQLK